MLVLVGASMMTAFAMVSSLVQLITTDDMRGRVMSVYNFAFRGGMPIGNLLSGWLVTYLGTACSKPHSGGQRMWPIGVLICKIVAAHPVPVVLGLNGSVLILVALYFLLVQRRVAAL